MFAFLSEQPVGLYTSSILSCANFLLGSAISYQRAQTKRTIGYDEKDLDSTLTKLARAHANHAEYSPTIIALMLFIESKVLMGKASNMKTVANLRLCMLLYVLGRASITCGLLSPNPLTKVSPFRRVGAVTNYLFGLALSIGVLYC